MPCRCICADGFMGADCSLRKCPYDNAWSDYAYATNKAHAPAECSNRGLCDRSSGQLMFVQQQKYAHIVL